MVRRGIGAALLATATLTAIVSSPATAIMVMPATLVGPPLFLSQGSCKLTFTRPGGAGPGTVIPFRALALGAPVERSPNSFITGGSGTANLAMAARLKAMGLPYQPPTVDPESRTLPVTFSVERGASMTSAPYQRLPLAASKQIADPNGLIFSQAVSPTKGRIVSLVLYRATRPTTRPRLQITVENAPDRGCRPQIVQIYAPAMSADALIQLLPASARYCIWINLSGCSRAHWPRGRILFVSATYGKAFEYRWIDYDLLADWQFGKAVTPRR